MAPTTAPLRQRCDDGAVSTVVVFHHALGLTPGVAQFAGALREAGHDVHTPDLFDGQTFDSVEAGVAHASTIGFGEIARRGTSSLDALELGAEPVVVVGFSLGVLPAQRLAQTDSRVSAAVLCHSCVPLGEFGDAWPDDVSLQIHAMEEDPLFLDEGDMDAALDLIGSVADAELFLYPGEQHLFADASLPSHDAGATAQLIERTLDVL